MKAIISSTAKDLPEHRKPAIEACLKAGFHPVAMEHLSARDATGVQASFGMVEQADVYIGIYAWRYGWVPDDGEKSITEMEFDWALERPARGEIKDILIFVADGTHPFRFGDVEADAEVVAQPRTGFRPHSLGRPGPSTDTRYGDTPQAR